MFWRKERITLKFLQYDGDEGMMKNYCKLNESRDKKNSLTTATQLKER